MQFVEFRGGHSVSIAVPRFEVVEALPVEAHSGKSGMAQPATLAELIGASADCRASGSVRRHFDVSAPIVFGQTHAHLRILSHCWSWMMLKVKPETNHTF